MFSRYKVIRRLKLESDRVAVPGESRAHDTARAGGTTALKFAVSFALVLAVLASGVLPLSRTAQNLNFSGAVKDAGAAGNVNQASSAHHSLTLVAYAAAKGAGGAFSAAADSKTATVLAPDMRVTLPSGKFNQDHDNHENTPVNANWVDSAGVKHYASYTFESSYLECKGDGLKTVTYISENGDLDFFDHNLYHQMDQAGQLFICKIDMSPYLDSQSADGDRAMTLFQKMWNGGSFDSYKASYFSGKSTDLNDYAWGCSIGYNDTAKTRTVEIRIAEKNAPEPYYQHGKTVTAGPDALVSWGPSSSVWETVDTQEHFTGYASLPGDTVTVKATFDDGQTVVKTVAIGFDKDGSAVATLKD